MSLSYLRSRRAPRGLCARVALVALTAATAAVAPAAAATLPAPGAPTPATATAPGATPATSATAPSATPATTTTGPNATIAPAPAAAGAGSGSAETTTAVPAATSTPGLGSRTLREGMSGHDVSVLQAYLTLAGYPVGMSGYFGPVTTSQVNAFKHAIGLIPNGVVGSAMMAELTAKVTAVEADGAVNIARINSNGTATPPVNAPVAVREVIAAANQIIAKPYIYGGGHAGFTAAGYDCSGAVSYALHGAGLISSPEASTALESWRSAGKGRWITVYANASHAFLVIAGRAFDTANFGGPNIPAGSGPRWRSHPYANLNDGSGGYVARHPAGL